MIREHEFEPVVGLPEPLPAGERILWQGAPTWLSVARRAFHVDHLSVYFALLLVLRASMVVADGGSAAEAGMAIAWLLPPALFVIGIFLLMGRLVGQTTLYTITTRRLVMRVGIVLTVTFNIPFRVLESAGLKKHADGTGDIALVLSATQRIGYFHLWPHVRPWRFARPEPMLRSLENSTHVADLLAAAISAAEGIALRQTAQSDVESVPANEGSPLVTAQ
jgi:hypothetical protein